MGGTESKRCFPLSCYERPHRWRRKPASLVISADPPEEMHRAGGDKKLSKISFANRSSASGPRVLCLFFKDAILRQPCFRGSHRIPMRNHTEYGEPGWAYHSGCVDSDRDVSHPVRSCPDECRTFSPQVELTLPRKIVIFRIREVVMEPSENFAHRLNANGSFESICLYCFQTVAISSSEEELVKPESGHICHREPKESVRGMTVNRKERVFGARG
jgi:hypothetical protein